MGGRPADKCGGTISRWLMAKRYGDFRVDYFHDGRHSIKSLQRDAILGRWDGHTLNLGGVGRMAAEHRCVVAVDCGGVHEMRRPAKNEAAVKKEPVFRSRTLWG